MKQHKRYGDDRGDELPEGLRSKQKLKEKIKEVLEQLNSDKERINLRPLLFYLHTIAIV